MLQEQEDQGKYIYDPTDEEKHIRGKVYKDFYQMRNLRNQRYKYFNDRTLKEFIDDSDLRLSCYVPTREEQGKEDWQANFSHPTTQNKMHATLAGVALDVPDTRIVAKNENSIKSAQRAYVMKNLVKHSYDKDNKEEEIYNEAFECAAKGTVIVYDGYIKQKGKIKEVKKYDPVTGAIEIEEHEVIIKDEIDNFIVRLEDIYIWNFFIPNIQDQPKIIWADKMEVEKFKAEFNQFPNFKYVKTAKKLFNKDLESRYFNEAWSNRAKGGIEVVRYYDKFNDSHVVLANGVVLFNGPMLLGKDMKWYPFAKTIYSMFAVDFFYGNSLPNKLMGEQDVTDALYNMAVDKTYKSMVPGLLIGNTNKDDFDLEDPYISMDTKIYVQDINQVKVMPVEGITSADVKVIDMVNRGMDMTSVDANQQGISGGRQGVTAREIVIANENARKLKGVFYMFLTSLWIQKIKLRIMNVLTFYTDMEVKHQLNEASNDKDNKLDNYKRFMVESADLGNGVKGTLGIRMVGKEEQLPTEGELDQTSKDTSERMKENYKEIAITSDYLDNWTYDVTVISESIFQKESSLSQAKMEGKLQIMGQAFPEFFAQNKEKIFKQFMIAYDDDPDEYDTTPPQPPQDQTTQSQGQPQPPTEGAAIPNEAKNPKEPIQTGA